MKTLEEWADELSLRRTRDEYRDVIWMTNAEVDEMCDQVWGRGRRSRLPMAFMGTPVAVIDQPPERVPYCPICARRDNACNPEQGVILSARSGSVPPVKVEARP